MADESSSTHQPSPESGDGSQHSTAHAAGVGIRGLAQRPWLAKAVSAVTLLAIHSRTALTHAYSHLSLFRIQAFVAVVTGLVTITVGVHSLTHSAGPGTGIGEVIAVVKDAVTAQSVTDATIEILTPNDALVATLTPDSEGRARQSLQEGRYVVRVNHPNYAADVRQIQVFSKQIIEVKATLRAGSGPPFEPARRAVGAMRRAFHF